MTNTSVLPTWVERPLTMDEAAIALGICRRTLVYKLKDFPYFAKRGNRKIFYPEHIAQIREAIDCPDSSYTSGAIGGIVEARYEADAYEKALALIAEKSRRNSAKISKQESGKVIPIRQNK